jgi:hypothetical protein
MTEEIKVYVIDKGRKFLYLRYIDPATNKTRSVSNNG